VADLNQLIKTWDEAFWELSEAFRGLPDEDVWRRPHDRLLSIGEVAGHIVYSEAVRLTGPGADLHPDLAAVPVKSPLIIAAFSYYPRSVESPIQLNLTALEVAAEVQRVHQEVKAHVLEIERDSEDPLPRYGGMSTWGANLRYMVFHVAYHTGQIYSARHFLGHETPDN
jgi:uncharacterized damage-inducible protein DinB